MAAAIILFAVSAIVATPDALALPQQGPPSGPEGVIDALLNEYRKLALNWHQRLLGPAQSLFFVLLTVQGVFIGGQLGLAQYQDQFNRTANATSRGVKFLIFGAVASVLIATSDQWINALYTTFVQAGSLAATGSFSMEAVSPSGLMERCYQVVARIWQEADKVGLTSIWGASAGGLLGCIIATICTYLAFIGMTIQIVITEIGFYLALGCAPIFLCFAAFPATAGLTEGYLKFVVYICVKMFVLFLLVGVAKDLPVNMLALFEGTTNIPDPGLWDYLFKGVEIQDEEKQYILVQRASQAVAVASASVLIIIAALPITFARMVSRHVDIDVEKLAQW